MFRAAKTTAITTIAFTAITLMLSSCGVSNDSLDNTTPIEQTTENSYVPPTTTEFEQDTQENPYAESDCYNGFGLKVRPNAFPCYDVFGYDEFGYDYAGFDRFGYDNFGYDKFGYNRSGYDRLGYDQNGYNKFGYDKGGRDASGCWNIDNKDTFGNDC